MNVAIKGHPTRGKEVIEILELLGGRNPHNYCADCDSLCFTIGKGTNIIYYDWVKECYEDEDTLVFTLEEFLEKFPYKVGDKVRTVYGRIGIINKPIWSNRDNCIRYELEADTDSFYFVNELQPYKEETIKESIDKTNKVIFDTQAQCCDIMNDIIKKDMEEIDIIEPITEINLNHPCFDEHNEIELIIPNGWKFEQRGNKMFGIRKQYPKTYEECCGVLKIPNDERYIDIDIPLDYNKLLSAFTELLICRDAYWKIAGDWEEKRKGKAMHYIICSNLLGEVVKNTMPNCIANYLLDFPTEEMRNAFYNNFKDLIEQCKELL